MKGKKQIHPIIERTISWQSWLAGREERRRLGNLVAPREIRRQSSPDDRHLRKLFQGKRGLPFPKKLKTEAT